MEDIDDVARVRRCKGGAIFATTSKIDIGNECGPGRWIRESE